MSESGYYRASDPSVSMDDWITLNFTAVPTEIVNELTEEDYPLESCNPLEEPNEEDFMIAEEGEEEEVDFDAYQEAVEEYQNQLGGLPMWGTMWMAREDAYLRDALSNSGFDAWEVSNYCMLSSMVDARTAIGVIVFGVKGAGYSFHASHWIPLRAEMCKSRYEAGYLTRESYESILNFLYQELTSLGKYDAEDFLNNFSKAQAAA